MRVLFIIVVDIKSADRGANSGVGGVRRKAARGKFAFLRRVLWCAWRGSRPDLVICGHLNLLPAAWLLARLRGCALGAIIHGIEAWKQRSWLYGLMLKSAFGRNVDDGSAQTLCRTQDVRTAERTRSFR
jgi:hypothetical protein